MSDKAAIVVVNSDRVAAGNRSGPAAMMSAGESPDTGPFKYALISPDADP